MMDTNPPKERALTTNDTRRLAKLLPIAEDTFRLHASRLAFGRDLMRLEEDEKEAEALGAETWALIYDGEPDPTRRARLWLAGRKLVTDWGLSKNDPSGMRAMQHWVRAELRFGRCQPR